MKKDSIPNCCEGCKMWHTHQDKCWYYWELKKDCTMHTDKQGI